MKTHTHFLAGRLLAHPPRPHCKLSLLTTTANAVKVAILDGVLYIPGRHKMYSHLEAHPEQNIVSALVLREFLYAL